MNPSDRPNRPGFPERGVSREAIRAALAEHQRDDVPAHGTHNFRPNYFIGDDVLALIDEVSAAVAEQNVLYADSSFPSLRAIEQELVEMGLDLFNAPEGAGGTVTTGGSESNFLAVKTARYLFAATHPERAPFKLVLARSAIKAPLGMCRRRAMPGAISSAPKAAEVPSCSTTATT